MQMVEDMSEGEKNALYARLLDKVVHISPVAYYQGSDGRLRQVEWSQIQDPEKW
jgi:hypothetical protein